ncbi:MAG TPA: hypothetical protein VKY44_05485 [Flavobacterium sp.]|nr:hypothetical protein [Flavobacterium sp.]
MENTIINILKSVSDEYKNKNITYFELFNNYLNLFRNSEYKVLYKNISGFLAHSEVDKSTYDQLSLVLTLLEEKYI